MRARLISASLIVGVGIVVATVDCYGPTEVTVVLTTDLACSEKPRTSIFKGQPGQIESTIEAETQTCETIPTERDAKIGTLVFVPSGAKDGRAGVRIILARNGKSPTACDGNPADCIFATRTFAFAEHASRQVPIRLLRECIGVRCPEGKTCSIGGTCAVNEVACDGDYCSIPGEPPPGNVNPPVTDPDSSLPTNNDADPDPGFDATVPTPKDGSTTNNPDGGEPIVDPNCHAPTGVDDDILATAGELPLRAAASPMHFAWFAKGTASFDNAYKMTKTGSPPGTFTKQVLVGLGETTHGIGINSDGLITVAYDNTSNEPRAWKEDIGAANPYFLVGAGGSERPIIIDTNVAVVGGATGVQRQVGNSFSQLFNKATVSLAMDATSYYAAASDGVWRIDRTTGQPANALISGTPKNAVVGIESRDTGFGAVYATGADPVTMNGTYVVQRIDLSGTAQTLLTSRPPIDSVSGDGLFIYWIENESSVWRIDVLEGTFDQLVPSVSGRKIKHMKVDPGPLGCMYFWTKSASNPKAALRIEKKMKLATLPEPPP